MAKPSANKSRTSSEVKTPAAGARSKAKGQAKRGTSKRETAKPSAKTKRPEGRPTKYDPALHLPLVEAWAAVGLTEQQIAGKLGISKATLTTWKKEHPEFLASLKKGKELPDDLVEASLFARATGYNFKSVKIFMPAGAKNPVYAPFIEHCPPDVTAQIFWLKNRRPTDWRDKQEIDARILEPPKLELTLQTVSVPEPKP